MAEQRRPGLVPDETFTVIAAGHTDVRRGVDTDGDGHPDTLLTDDGVDLLVHTDTDGDGLADQVLRIGSDAAVREVAPQPFPGALTGIWDGVSALDQ